MFQASTMELWNCDDSIPKLTVYCASELLRYHNRSIIYKLSVVLASIIFHFILPFAVLVLCPPERWMETETKIIMKWLGSGSMKWADLTSAKKRNDVNKLYLGTGDKRVNSLKQQRDGEQLRQWS